MPRICKNCGSTRFEKDAVHGVSACSNCGDVIEESDVVVDEPTFSKESDGSSSLVGRYVASGNSSLYNRVGAGHAIDHKQSEDAGRRVVDEMSAVLKVPPDTSAAAFRHYKLAIANNFIRGRRIRYVAAACLAIACRRDRTPHMMIDFAELIPGNVYSLGATFVKLCRTLNIMIPLVDPTLYIHRFASQLDFGLKTQAVANTAAKIVQRMGRDWIHTGRRPSGISGAALLVAARLHGFSRTPSEITRIVRVSDTTLRRRLIEFADTHAGSSTAGDFMAGDDGAGSKGGASPQSEEVPPSFARARQLEERERLHLELWKRKLAGESVEELLEEERLRLEKLKVERSSSRSQSEATPTPDELTPPPRSVTPKRKREDEEDKEEQKQGQREEPSPTTKQETEEDSTTEDEEMDPEAKVDEPAAVSLKHSDYKIPVTKKQKKAAAAKKKSKSKLDDLGSAKDLAFDQVEQEIREALQKSEFLKIEVDAKRVLQNRASGFDLSVTLPDTAQTEGAQAGGIWPTDRHPDVPIRMPIPQAPPAVDPTAKPVEESLDDVPDSDIDRYLFSESDSKLKETAWDAMYSEWLAEKKKREALSGEKKPKSTAPRKPRTPVSLQAAASAAEAARQALKSKPSARVNYSALNSLFAGQLGESPQQPQSPAASVSPAPQPASATTASAPSATAAATDSGDDEDLEEEEDEEEPQEHLTLAQKVARRGRVDDMVTESISERLGMKTSTQQDQQDYYDDDDLGFFEDDDD